VIKKIALEEHFLDPATEPYWHPTMVDVAPQKKTQLYGALTDFGEQRLQMMDKTGIARAVLAIAGPGVQAERATTVAVKRARESNDFLAKQVQKRPIPASLTLQCRTRKLRPTSWNAACVNLSFAAP
jgi:2,3-dihydroxybenzoate decarboxylase